MICNPCIAGGVAQSAGSYDSALLLHQQCKGDCPCQHKTGAGLVVHRGEKVPPMRTQSP